MELTDEMRRAVREEDCARLGHILSYDNTLVFDSGRGARVAGPGDMQPHIDCQRCAKVWLVMEQPGDDYQAAVAERDAQLLPEHRSSTQTTTTETTVQDEPTRQA